MVMENYNKKVQKKLMELMVKVKQAAGIRKKRKASYHGPRGEVDGHFTGIQLEI